MRKYRYRGILADLDGTMNKGDTLIPGALDVYLRLSRNGMKWLFLSNNATRPDSELAKKVQALGIPISEEQVVNSATALIRALQTEKPAARVLIVGEHKLRDALTKAHVAVVDDPDQAEIVVAAMDRRFDYEKLRKAQEAILKGALFWATNLDASLPTENGVRPGAGSIVAAIATAAGRAPDRVLGKPSPDMAAIALERLGLPAEACLVVGDRMETDVLFARNAGIDSGLVLTGATSMEDLSRFTYAPDHVLESIVNVEGLLDEHGEAADAM